MRIKKYIVGVATSVCIGLLLFSVDVHGSEALPTAGFYADLESIEPVEAVYILTEEEKLLLKQIGVHEAGEIDVEGIAHVMQVVLNRCEDERFPDTVSEVIFQKNPRQFTTAKQLARVKTTEAADNALNSVILGEYTENEALYFESLKGKAWVRCHDYLFSYGGHDFYK